MQYFRECKTLDEAKNLFRKLAHKLHPDKGGTHAEFIDLMKQFENYRPTFARETDQNFDRGKFYNLCRIFDKFDGLKISFVGSFIWIEDLEPGATYKHHKALKEIKIEGMKPCYFARKKQAWYFSPLDYSQKHASKKSLDQIKTTWGCKSFHTEGNKQLN